ncbi:zf-CCHC domain-containing protein [Tanacetum coccineum]|uniref:Zf-CCHC domain-containing protein n=1 Tax=Tanacetum coccineum TaxID=301880 RepID=A0ABQ5IL95_9ASTR
MGNICMKMEVPNPNGAQVRDKMINIIHLNKPDESKSLTYFRFLIRNESIHNDSIIITRLPKIASRSDQRNESIDNDFARFNTIITSLKALDESYSSNNHVRKFIRALHPKWRAKVTTIEESKDLTSLSLDELIRNLKVHEMIIKKDLEIVKAKGERKSLALKAKKESSDEECSTFGSEDEKYAMAVRDFKKLFKGREFLKPPKDKNQRAFVGGFWSDSGEEDDEKAKDETCLVAQASNEACSDSSYFSDEITEETSTP